MTQNSRNIQNSGSPAAFVQLLQELDRGELAQLRRTLSGDEASAYWLERLYIRAGYGQGRENRSARAMLGLLAGLYALKPKPQKEEQASEETGGSAEGASDAASSGVTVGALMGQLYLLQGKRPSTEKRFLTLLDADREGLRYHLRQAVNLLAAEDLTPDWERLAADLVYWGDPVRRRWASDFYGEVARAQEAQEKEQEKKQKQQAKSTPAPAASDSSGPLFADLDHNSGQNAGQNTAQDSQEEEGDTL